MWQANSVWLEIRRSGSEPDDAMITARRELEIARITARAGARDMVSRILIELAVAESSHRLDIVIGQRADLVSVADGEWLLITTDTHVITAARAKLLYHATVAREGDTHAVLQ
jgi:hypothetical protein